MIKIPYENILQKIQEKANVSKEDIEVKVKQKMEQLDLFLWLVVDWILSEIGGKLGG